ncbi:leucine-rich repeat protein [Liberiplasma polymorphum]|uniref:leucine-rich repeat protein n=1 Tax=Liberiplasma polymorphum TaxID=3374570 RepID=UPI0037754CFB
MKKVILGLVLSMIIFTLIACDLSQNTPKLDEYEVVFLNHDGTIISRQSIEKGDSATPPATPFKEGYIFIGWSHEYANIQSSRVIEPQFHPREFSISFVTYGGTFVEPINALYNQPIPIMDIESTKEGYHFIGWYYDPQFSEAAVDLYIRPLMPSQNITLYAKWVEQEGKDLSYTIFNNQATIDYYHGSAKTYEVPESINGYPVTKIAQNAFKDNHHINEVIIPSSVEIVEAFAFYNASNLELITFNENSNIKYIGYQAFQDTKWMRNQEHQLILEGLLFGFKHDHYTVVTLSEDIHVILPHAFTDLKNIKTLYIPDQVEMIDSYTFYHHPSIEQIHFTETSNLKIIKSYAFAQSTLKHINLPPSIEEIQEAAFEGASLERFNFPEHSNITYLGSNLFKDNVFLTEINFPKSQTVIPKGFLTNTSALETFEISSHIKSVEENAFKFSGLKGHLIIPSSVEVIEHHAFAYNLALESILFESGETNLEIHEYAFSVMDALREVILPNHDTKVHDFAFAYNSRLTMIYIPNQTQLETRIFQGSNLVHIFLEEETLNESFSKQWDFGIESKNIFENVISYGRNEAYKYIYLNDSELFIYCIITDNVEITIPNEIDEFTVRALGALILYNLEHIETLELPNTITYLGDYVFSHPNLSAITFPEDSILTIIPYYGFAFNEAMTEITLPASITTIKEFAFTKMESLESIHFMASSQLEIIYPFAFSNNPLLQTVDFSTHKDLHTIGAFAFSDNLSLKSIHIPLSVKYIEFFAFSNTPNLIITTDYASKPSTWDLAWNPDNQQVIWENEPSE